jgi:hypothetical protein
MGDDPMKDPTDLQWMYGILIILLVFYSIAMFIVFLTLLLLGAFGYSLLFDDTLFTQEGFFLVYGSIFYLLGGFILIFSVIGLALLKRRVRKQMDPEKKGSKLDRMIPIVGGLLLLGMIITGILSFNDEEEFIFFAISGPILFIILYLNWKVIDIPAKTIALFRRKSILKLSRDASTPMIIALFSFIPIIYCVRFEDAPLSTVFAVYLETLFVLSVMFTFISMIVMLYHLSKQIKEMKGVLDLKDMDINYREDTRLFLSEE